MEGKIGRDKTGNGAGMSADRHGLTEGWASRHKCVNALRAEHLQPSGALDGMQVRTVSTLSLKGACRAREKPEETNEH
jgi:hypothetical protein